ncbi:MAG: hypothetical protein U1E89_05335 [Burkholderiaceae bacterium]
MHRNEHETLAAPRRRRLLLAAALAGAWPARAAADEPPTVVSLPVPAGEIEVQFAPGFDAPARERLLAWVRAGAAAVAQWFGRFPVPRSELLLLPVDGDGVQGGASFGVPSPLIRIRAGRDVSEAQLRADWILTHEMVHLAVPQLPLRQRWLHEGIATYVEALARGHAGTVAAADVWQGWQRAMAQGQPAEHDRGLDFTPTWARTYWGGALFCLVADVRLRRSGDAQRGLQQALRGVLATGGDYRVRWIASRVLAAADAAVGGHTLVDLYDEMKDRPARVDLDALWRELGVGADGLRDDAPLAAVRRAILG